MLRRDFEHVQMDAWVLVAGEPQIANLAGLFRIHQGAVRTVFVEDAMRILIAKNLVVLHQVDVVGLQPNQRFVELTGCFCPAAAVDLRHQEHTIAIPVAKRASHADLAGAFVVIPAVVEKVDAAIDR